MSQIFKSVRIWVLIIFLLFALIAIHPNPWNEGVAIRSVESGSPASEGGILSPKPTQSLMSREKITAINNIPVKTIEDYYKIINDFDYNRTITITTNKKTYPIYLFQPSKNITTNETEYVEVTEEVINETTNETENITKYVEVPIIETVYLDIKPVEIGLSVYDAPKSNIKKGLDLQGGTRVLLKPQDKLDPADMNLLIDNLKERLNIYGLSDIVVKSVNDLAGAQYIVVEIPGATEKEVQDLISQQGKFEAKIGNDIVFVGGRDISYVCRTAECAFAVDPRYGCAPTGNENEYSCRFSFSISLTPDAANRQAELTKDLKILTENGQQYLEQDLQLFLDDQQVDVLKIGADLKGRATTEISISGSGVGVNQQAAAYDSLQNMKRLQTILITGSLPTKLDIEKVDTISPILGEEFMKNALIIGLLSIISVTLVILIRYRVWKLIIPIIITMISEIILLFGLASLISWNIDIAAIAGIIVAVGTGVDDQIVIADETIRGENKSLDWKKRFKKAFFIIFAAYSVTVVAMLPLLFAGAGLVKGLALTTIAGVTIGVLITRPAFAAIVQVLLKKE